MFVRFAHLPRSPLMTRLSKIVLTATLILLAGLPTTAAFAIGLSSAQRSAIRSMPIEKRPDRFGHFYGNAVRRRARGEAIFQRP